MAASYNWFYKGLLSPGRRPFSFTYGVILGFDRACTELVEVLILTLSKDSRASTGSA
ncbi:MAG TPA: hypothetical protein VK017_04995 [Sphingobacterium sp.]|nr:hypothetical protein [Sphingobacterium sp.]